MIRWVMITKSNQQLFTVILLGFFSLSSHAERVARSSSIGFQPAAAAPSVRPESPTGPQPLIYGARGGNGRRNGSLINVNGCAPNAGFKTIYGNPGNLRKGRRGPSCDKNLAMHRGLADFINKNLNGCLDKSANNAFGYGTLSADLNGGDNAIYHSGCMGDANHQHTGSWHNEGLAFDVNGFKVGNRILKYSDALNTKSAEGRKIASFFQNFRKCWSEAVVANGRSCSAGGRGQQKAAQGRAGSIGNEDRRHRNHLHLSLPCKAISNGRASFTADIWSLFLPAAHADEIDGDTDYEAHN